MGLFGCEHQWMDEKKIFNPSPLMFMEIRVTYFNRGEVEKLMYGMTNITQRCKVCGQLRILRVRGKVD